jgi:hypothetical protein
MTLPSVNRRQLVNAAGGWFVSAVHDPGLLLGTLKPTKGSEAATAFVTCTSRVLVDASAAMLMVTGKLVPVPPGRIVAVTPVSLKSTDVTPVKAVPLIVAGNDVPGSPDDGEIPVITGGAGFTVKPPTGTEVNPAAVTVSVRAPVAAADVIVMVTLIDVAVTVPLWITAVTPVPLNVTAVVPIRFVPLIIASRDEPVFPEGGSMLEIAGPGVVVTTNPLNAVEIPEGVVTVTVRIPGVAGPAIVIVTRRLVSVLPARSIDAATSFPENVTAVAPVRLTPVTVAATVAPGAPQFGDMVVIAGNGVPVPDNARVTEPAS